MGQYIKPELEVLDMEMQPLMAGSNELLMNNAYIDADAAETQGRRGRWYDDWDEDEY